MLVWLSGGIILIALHLCFLTKNRSSYVLSSNIGNCEGSQSVMVAVEKLLYCTCGKNVVGLLWFQKKVHVIWYIVSSEVSSEFTMWPSCIVGYVGGSFWKRQNCFLNCPQTGLLSKCALSGILYPLYQGATFLIYSLTQSDWGEISHSLADMHTVLYLLPWLPNDRA